MASAVQLTPHDKITLSLLFDPESSPSSNTAPISTSLPADPHYSASTFSKLQAIEREAIALASSSEPTSALPLLDDLVTSYPLYASGYNNRAQLRRLLCHPTAAIQADLTAAISHASPANAMAPVSPQQAKVLSAAYTQLGAVLLREGDEEKAGRAFMEGARFGGEVARVMAVKLNPVARLCGAIVKEAMKKEMMVG